MEISKINGSVIVDAKCRKEVSKLNDAYKLKTDKDETDRLFAAVDEKVNKANDDITTVNTELTKINASLSQKATKEELKAVDDKLPEIPSADGTYMLQVEVKSGVPTFSWALLVNSTPEA